jgi:hypothetical protein
LSPPWKHEAGRSAAYYGVTSSQKVDDSSPAEERRIDALFFGLRMIVVLVELALFSSFDPPTRGAAWRVAHDEHPSVAVVHPLTEPVIAFDAVRARSAMITQAAFGHLLGLSAETRVPVDLHWRGGMTKHPISAVSGKDQLIVLGSSSGKLGLLPLVGASNASPVGLGQPGFGWRPPLDSQPSG